MMTPLDQNGVLFLKVLQYSVSNDTHKAVPERLLNYRQVTIEGCLSCGQSNKKFIVSAS